VKNRRVKKNIFFRQDYRINKIFLPFQKKGKKNHPSSKEGSIIGPKNSKARGKASIVDYSALFSA